MSQYQLIPYNRVEEHFSEQMGLGISAGTNFTKFLMVRKALLD